MAIASLGTVISHWAHLIENLQSSPKEYYASIEKAFQKREIPDAGTSYVQWSESGMFSAKRLYLRVQRREHTIEICAAPFGTGFFVSEWLSVPGPDITLAVIYSAFAFLVLVGSFSSPVWEFMREARMEYAALLWFRGGVAFILFLLVVFGIIRPLYFPRPITYYWYDTAQMFFMSVHNAVLDVVDETTSVQGVRPLTESERKPIMREFYNYRR